MSNASESNLLELEQEQLQLASKVDDQFKVEDVKTVAGVDISYSKDAQFACALIAVLDASTLELVDVVHFLGAVKFPYIPQFLTYRELPLVRAAFGKLSVVPDLFIYDGNGRLHQRKCGAACMFGLEFNVSTIGCTKNPTNKLQEFYGSRGDYTHIYDETDQSITGVQLVTQTQIKPVYVSVGHKISLEQAIEYVIRYSPEYRIPEPIRVADQLSRKVIRNLEAQKEEKFASSI